MWNDLIYINIEYNHYQFIHFRISKNDEREDFLISIANDNLNYQKRKNLWEELTFIGSILMKHGS